MNEPTGVETNHLTQLEAEEVAGGALPDACSTANLVQQATMGAIGGASGFSAAGGPAGAFGGAVFGGAPGAASAAWGCANALASASSGGVGGSAAAGAPNAGRDSLSTGRDGSWLDSQ